MLFCKVKLLFVNYWGYNEGLTQATSLPHLHQLIALPKVDHLWFLTIERDGDANVQLIDEKITHIPFVSAHGLRAKLTDFTVVPRKLIALVKDKNIDLVICRGAPAGAFGYQIWCKTRVPYAVESYEPHAAYMLESGVWTRLDPRYQLERYWEKKQIATAKYLITVAEGYRQRLIEEGREPNSIFTQPCEVQLGEFYFQPEKRKELRKRLGIPEHHTVGIYVGKFGGLYLGLGTFQLIKACFDYWGEDHFSFIILTPQARAEWYPWLSQTKVPSSQVYTLSVTHQEVSQYLSVADFGLAPYSFSPSKRYLSPIKIGEYWACGLPVILTRGVGDESAFLEEEDLGIFYNPSDPRNLNLSQLGFILQNNTHREAIRKAAYKYRNPNASAEVYRSLIEEISR